MPANLRASYHSHFPYKFGTNSGQRINRKTAFCRLTYLDIHYNFYMIFATFNSPETTREFFLRGNAGSPRSREFRMILH